ncbi:MAG: hypothetical protein LBP56_00185 [Odoribacteraceae bacterium]|jgi:hypothetical protein|nr:hypothetical protein [Odoribacteraceae bacterium]
MKISELVKELNAVKRAHGDLDVYFPNGWDDNGAIPENIGNVDVMFDEPQGVYDEIRWVLIYGES